MRRKRHVNIVVSRGTDHLCGCTRVRKVFWPVGYFHYGKDEEAIVGYCPKCDTHYITTCMWTYRDFAALVGQLTFTMEEAQ